MGKHLITVEELRAGKYEIGELIEREYNGILRLFDKEIKMAHADNCNSCCVKIPPTFKNINSYKTRVIIDLKEAGYSVKEKFCTITQQYVLEISWLA